MLNSATDHASGQKCAICLLIQGKDLSDYKALINASVFENINKTSSMTGSKNLNKKRVQLKSSLGYKWKQQKVLLKTDTGLVMNKSNRTDQSWLSVDEYCLEIQIL